MKTHVVIGLEMHCEMKSHTKVFCPSLNTYSTMANTNISEVCLGLPGVMPTVNIECVKKAIKAALILNCEIPDILMFDRKNYYYPDLPRGFQLTQGTKPIGTHGYIDIEVEGKKKRVEISDIHLEDDAASLDHLDTMSLIDYNRCGVPLLECVTEPCFTSADEAVSFIDTMCKIYQYTDISDADTRKGQIRCDVNVNLQDENGKFVTPKVEVKNVNSISNVRDTILYEEKRQREALESGNLDSLEQETRRFDEATGTTIHMRSKVDAIDYKYFVEPNILPYKISNELIESVKKEIPMLALERKAIYINKFGLDEENAKVIVKDINMANYFEECVNIGIDPKTASNWLNGIITAYLNSEDILIKDFYLQPKFLKQIIDYLVDGTISSKQAKEVFYKALEENKEPKSFISKDSAQITDEKYLEEIIDNILANNEKNIEAYHNGKTNMFDFFVGQVMKETKGKASPVITKELLNKKLGN